MSYLAIPWHLLIVTDALKKKKLLSLNILNDLYFDTITYLKDFHDGSEGKESA